MVGSFAASIVLSIQATFLTACLGLAKHVMSSSGTGEQVMMSWAVISFEEFAVSQLGVSLGAT